MGLGRGKPEGRVGVEAEVEAAQLRLSSCAGRIARDEAAPRALSGREVTERKPHAAIVVERILVIGVEGQSAGIRLSSLSCLARGALRHRLAIEIPELLNLLVCRPRHLAFHNDDALIRGQVCALLTHTAGPHHHQRIHAGEGLEAEVLDQAVLREIGTLRANLANLAGTAGHDSYLGADPLPIALGTAQFHC